MNRNINLVQFHVSVVEKALAGLTYEEDMDHCTLRSVVSELALAFKDVAPQFDMRKFVENCRQEW